MIKRSSFHYAHYRTYNLKYVNYRVKNERITEINYK